MRYVISQITSNGNIHHLPNHNEKLWVQIWQYAHTLNSQHLYKLFFSLLPKSKRKIYKFHLFKNIQKLKYTLEKGPLHRDIISESPQVVSIMTLYQLNQMVWNGHWANHSRQMASKEKLNEILEIHYLLMLTHFKK